MVSQQLLEELKLIISEEYGQDLDIATVAEIGNGMVNYFDLLAKIYHEDKSN